MRVIGLTGPIGAGKSSVARVFRARGVAVLDADVIAREVTAPGSDCLRELALAFGAEMLRPDGTLDRAALAAQAFASPAGAARLGAITHPVIGAEVRRRLAELAAAGTRLAVLEAVMLPEGERALCDAVVLVTAPEAARLARVMARDGVGEASVRPRMAAQPSEAAYRAAATHILENTGDAAALQQQAERFLKTVNNE